LLVICIRQALPTRQIQRGFEAHLPTAQTKSTRDLRLALTVPESLIVSCPLFLFHMSFASINLLGNNLFSDSG